MAAMNKEDMHKKLKKLSQKFWLIEKYLDGLNKLTRSLRNLKRRQQILNRHFHDSLSPFYELGNITSLDFDDLSHLVFPAVVGSGTDKEAAMVVLAQSLDSFEKLADERLELINDLMRVPGIEPKRSTAIAAIESDDKMGTPPDFSSPADLSMGKETQETQETEEAQSLSVLRNIALQLYGFSIDIADDIEDSLHNRKLVQDDIEFGTDEAAIGFDEYPGYGKWQEDDAELRSWIMVKKLKIKFEELKKELYKTKEVDDQSAEPAKVSSEPDKEDPNITRSNKIFLKVIRNWIFHFESILVHLVYEIFDMMSENKASKTIFQEFLTKLNALKEINNGLVPIAVYKVLELIKDPYRLWAPKEEESDSDKEQLNEKIRLSDVMDLIHGIMERLRTVLVISTLTGTQLVIPAEALENTLKQIEEDLRAIQRKIKRANSRARRSKETENLNEEMNIEAREK